MEQLDLSVEVHILLRNLLGEHMNWIHVEQLDLSVRGSYFT